MKVLKNNQTFDCFLNKFKNRCVHLCLEFEDWDVNRDTERTFWMCELRQLESQTTNVRLSLRRQYNQNLGTCHVNLNEVVFFICLKSVGEELKQSTETAETESQPVETRATVATQQAQPLVSVKAVSD